MSNEAEIARRTGAAAMCPGCMIEKKIPENRHGAALHKMPNGSNYECHANSDAWREVPEFVEQEASHE